MTRPFVAALLALASLDLAAAEPPAPSGAAPGAVAPAPSVVRYADDKLTVQVKNMPAEALLAEIAEQAGAKVTGTVERTTPVTADWKALPVKDALGQILETQNFTLTYGEKGELRTIALRGTQQAGGPAAAPAGPDGSQESAAEVAVYRAFGTPDQVPIDGAVAKRLGKDTASWDLLTNTAIGDDDPAVRRAAVEAGVEAFEANEALRQQVMMATGGMSDAQLASWARARMFHRAEDFIRNLRRATSLPDIRARARAVLRELRKIPFKGPIPVEGGGPTTAE
jgi:hypothetical protein